MVVRAGRLRRVWSGGQRSLQGSGVVALSSQGQLCSLLGPHFHRVTVKREAVAARPSFPLQLPSPLQGRAGGQQLWMKADPAQPCPSALQERGREKLIKNYGSSLLLLPVALQHGCEN